jgi:hypothetical protein
MYCTVDTVGIKICLSVYVLKGGQAYCWHCWHFNMFICQCTVLLTLLAFKSVYLSMYWVVVRRTVDTVGIWICLSVYVLSGGQVYCWHCWHLNLSICLCTVLLTLLAFKYVYLSMYWVVVRCNVDTVGIWICLSVYVLYCWHCWHLNMSICLCTEWWSGVLLTLLAFEYVYLSMYWVVVRYTVETVGI